MSTISLRAYNREIDSYIDQSRLDEAIAHCRHILSKFPKHISTYRILGKAYLENNQNSNAADIFQRVLSAVPDDFISHVGMSVIREEEGNLAAAVLHMEKAFEKQPYNSEIQIELRRLYGKRDGIEPPKVRLTQGALARMYIRGDQIKLGIAELRTAIGENPERYDLRTLLAETYLTGDQLANAIDLASDILKKYPFNLIANRIMAKTLKTHDHPQEMAICRKRLYALSPYEAYISEHASTLEQVPDRAITIDQIEWDETQQNLPTETRESRSPWSSSQGRTDRIKGNENVPDWLSPTTREKRLLCLTKILELLCRKIKAQTQTVMIRMI
ncbi:MAG: tetratricopeptide repeat protein [Anaerolineales bacterium]|nr:tetratricopeptide repeat protein [Anaerolineales bacterium]